MKRLIWTGALGIVIAGMATAAYLMSFLHFSSSTELRIRAVDGLQQVTNGRPLETLEQREYDGASLPQIVADETEKLEIPERGSLQLVAFAVRTAYDDSLDPLNYRDAVSGEPIEPPLDSLPLPQTKRAWGKEVPQLRIIFQREDVSSFELRRCYVFDARTHVDVSNIYRDLILLTDKYIVIDHYLQIWHDTPVRLMYDLERPESNRVEARLWFKLPGLPDLPNQRDKKNLFQVKIPKATFTSNSDAESHLWSISQAVEMQLDYGSIRPEMVVPEEDLPLIWTNTTPQKLLDEFRRYCPNSAVTVDQASHLIHVRPRQPLKEKLEVWWAKNKPDWF